MTEIDVWDSSRQRQGRRFEPTRELPLHDLAVSQSLHLRGADRGLLLIRELAGPLGIPDLTALVGSSSSLDARLGLDVPPLLNEIDAGIVASTHSAVPRSVDTIANGLGWPTSTVERRLPYLLKFGAVIRSARGTYLRPEALQPVGRLVAFEAKVDDWRGALAQARSYGVWAENYVIVMERVSRTAHEILEREVALDAGGLIVDGRWALHPRRKPIPRSKRLWGSEHFVAALVGADHQPSTAP